MRKTLIALIVGLVLGVVGAQFLLVGSWLNLIPWGIGGVAIGYCGTRRESVINGVCYGFVLTFAFMIAGYTGIFPLASRLPFFAILGVFGGICGLFLGLVGFQVRTWRSKNKGRSETNHA